ncbi:Delta(24)-sterol reductase [Paramyrothecium foliicola]|nr:Delta(24)-sterol reductase [Paramyrothecium foliicola]
MDQHSHAVNSISVAVRQFFKLGATYRVFHGSSNSTRPRHGPKQNIVDISMLSNVLSVDTERRVALVEPNVPMDRLVEATLAYGLVPPVVMEFPGITAGGGFSGTSGESSSFKHGFFNDTINFVEIVLGNGDVVKASGEERADLFQGAAGAVGTLGIVTMMELRLVEARKFVKTTYHKVQRISDAVEGIKRNTLDLNNDYIDGIVFSPDHSVIVTGQLTDTKPPEHTIRTFSNASDPWFYLHVQDLTRSMSPSTEFVEYIPLSEYLFRYDRAGFWVGRQGYTYFKLIPFTKFFRWLLDDYSHTRTLYHALHASGISSQFVVQDLALPYDTAETFINWVDRELGIWPLWLCPLRQCSMPTFHPVSKSPKEWSPGEQEKKTSSITSQPMLNVGVWGWGPPSSAEFIAKNRKLEQKLKEFGGRKWLYAHTYYTEEEFWTEYDHSWYQALRKKYRALGLPTVYDKVKVEPQAKWKSNENRMSSWLSMWPIGGLYGMVLATISGDINLHRQAKWRFKSE